MTEETLTKVIHEVYIKFKLYYYHRIFRKLPVDEKNSLTALEAFCAEAIYGLGEPTLTEFANFINVSQPNAAYKVANLEKKGYIHKAKSDEDGRIVRLSVTDKFLKLYGSSERYVAILAKRIQKKFSDEDVEVFNSVLQSISDEMMQEVDRYLINNADLPEGVYPE